MDTFDKLKEKENIYVFTFEDFATNTDTCLKHICDFIKAPKTLYTPIVLEREKVPREINQKDIEDKFSEIKKLASNEYLSYLNLLLDKYEDKTLI